MTRQEEINEFNAMLGALAKKYNVSLGVSIVDLAKTEPAALSEIPTPEVV